MDAATRVRCYALLSRSPAIHSACAYFIMYLFLLLLCLSFLRTEHLQLVDTRNVVRFRLDALSDA